MSTVAKTKTTITRVTSGSNAADFQKKLSVCFATDSREWRVPSWMTEPG
jgi:hypothetical protein